MSALLDRLRAAGVGLRVEAGRLLVRGELSDVQRDFLRTHREALIAELSRRCIVPDCRETAAVGRFCRAHGYGVGVRGDGRRVSWDGFLLDDDGLVIIHDPCDGDGCGACEQTGLVLADGMT